MTATSTADPLAWQASGACRGVDPELWFDTQDPYARRAAQAVCAACPVLTACREYAVTAREPDGIWGGLTPGQRQAIYRRASAAGVSPVAMLAMPARSEPKTRGGRPVAPIEELAARYVAGESVKQIAASIDRNDGNVYRRLVAAGVQMRPRGVRPTSTAPTGDPPQPSRTA